MLMILILISLFELPPEDSGTPHDLGDSTEPPATIIHYYNRKAEALERRTRPKAEANGEDAGEREEIIVIIMIIIINVVITNDGVGVAPAPPVRRSSASAFRLL